MRLLGLLVAAAIASAQNFTQRGFLEVTGLGFPQTAPNDSGRAVAEGLFRYEASYKLGARWRLAGGIDARTDSHRQTERRFHFSPRDRDRLRPAFALRGLSASYSRGKLTVEAGKQIIRWGKTDILRPTDRFAPQDYLNVVNAEVLGVTATRLIYGSQTNSIDLIYSPWLTPSRVPLLDQRWALQRSAATIRELEPSIPGGPQFGARWNHTGTTEYSVSYYQGHDYLPLFQVAPVPPPPVPPAQPDTPAPVIPPMRPVFTVQRFYPQIRMFGGDAAIPLSFATLKGEAAYFTSSDKRSDEYVLYVAQLERHVGEWFFVGGYAGEAVTDRRATAGVSPLRGIARTVIARAGYTIDVNRSFSFEGALRDNGDGVWLRPEYTHAFGQHWRVTLGMAWISGASGDFLGQYRRNRHAILRIRYSF